MKKNLKLLSGILMASVISNTTLNPINFAKARTSRSVVVNSDTNNVDNASPQIASARSVDTQDEDSSEGISTRTSNEETLMDDSSEEDLDITDTEELSEDDEELDEDSYEDSEDEEYLYEDDEELDEDEELEENTTNVLDMLNSNEDISLEEIAQLSMPVSHSLAFKDELKTTFPNFEPLRQISPLYSDIENYLDVNLNETKSITKFLNEGSGEPTIYSDQNKCNMLLYEIDRILKEVTDEISSELPSTIFSLTPTLAVFSDTYQILSLEYSSVIQSNPNNKITLDILLKDIEDRLSSLLSTINEFREQLPDVLDTLNELAESSASSNSSSNSYDDDEEYLDDEDLTDEDELDYEDGELTDEDELNYEDEDEDSTDEELTDEDELDYEDYEDYENEEEIIDEEEDTDEEKKEDTPKEEQVDPNSITVYFGEQGQELIYDEKSKKYYQLDPEDPNSEDLIEYTGSVNKMTLAQYLNTEVYFDDKGNELMYDADTNSYFLYDTENDEFGVYTGPVTKKKMKDLLEEQNK